MKGLVEDVARLVMLQFNVNPSLVLPCIKRRESAVTGKKVPLIRGEQFIPPTEDLYLLPLLTDLALDGYELVDSFSDVQSRDNYDQGVMRLIFAAPGHAKPSEEFRELRGKIYEEVSDFLRASWTGCGYINPLFQDGGEVDGGYTVSLNFKACRAFFDRQGNPVKHWRRDERGKKIGDGPVPLTPKKFLRIEDGAICVVKGL